MGKITAKRILAALCLCLAGAAISALLLMQHHGEGRAVSMVNRVCGDGQTSGCEEVARSSWSSLAGFPVAALGLLFYASLGLALAIALLAPDGIRLTVSGVVVAALALGLLVDLFLLGVQVVSIRAYCGLCILTYLLGAGALVSLLPARLGALGTRGALGRVEGRLALGGWALSTLAVAAAVLGADATLRHRAAERQARLLGAPAPVHPPMLPADARPVPLPGATPSGAGVPAGAPPEPGDVAYWRDRARQLQETLDDPRKLDAYFADKARREYNAASPVEIDLEGAPALGPATAPVKVVEYSDFLCPFCRNLAGALAQFVPQAGGRVVVYFKNYPLDAACNPNMKQSTHPGACTLALGAVCAQSLGKFEAYHDRVFSTELRNPQPADVVRLAGEAGLDPAATERCLQDPQTRRRLDAQIAEANRLGIAATPTLFVNGKKLPRINDFVQVVDSEARKKGFAPLAAP